MNESETRAEEVKKIFSDFQDTRGGGYVISYEWIKTP